MDVIDAGHGLVVVGTNDLQLDRVAVGRGDDVLARETKPMDGATISSSAIFMMLAISAYSAAPCGDAASATNSSRLFTSRASIAGIMASIARMRGSSRSSDSGS